MIVTGLPSNSVGVPLMLNRPLRLRENSNDRMEEATMTTNLAQNNSNRTNNLDDDHSESDRLEAEQVPDCVTNENLRKNFYELRTRLCRRDESLRELVAFKILQYLEVEADRILRELNERASSPGKRARARTSIAAMAVILSQPQKAELNLRVRQLAKYFMSRSTPETAENVKDLSDFVSRVHQLHRVLCKTGVYDDILKVESSEASMASQKEYDPRTRDKELREFYWDYYLSLLRIWDGVPKESGTGHHFRYTEMRDFQGLIVDEALEVMVSSTAGSREELLAILKDSVTIRVFNDPAAHKRRPKWIRKAKPAMEEAKNAEAGKAAAINNDSQVETTKEREKEEDDDDDNGKEDESGSVEDDHPPNQKCRARKSGKESESSIQSSKPQTQQQTKSKRKLSVEKDEAESDDSTTDAFAPVARPPFKRPSIHSVTKPKPVPVASLKLKNLAKRSVAGVIYNASADNSKSGSSKQKGKEPVYPLPVSLNKPGPHSSKNAAEKAASGLGGQTGSQESEKLGASVDNKMRKHSREKDGEERQEEDYFDRQEEASGSQREARREKSQSVYYSPPGSPTEIMLVDPDKTLVVQPEDLGKINQTTPPTKRKRAMGTGSSRATPVPTSPDAKVVPDSYEVSYPPGASHHQGQNGKRRKMRSESEISMSSGPSKITESDMFGGNQSQDPDWQYSPSNLGESKVGSGDEDGYDNEDEDEDVLKRETVTPETESEHGRVSSRYSPLTQATLTSMRGQPQLHTSMRKSHAVEKTLKEEEEAEGQENEENEEEVAGEDEEEREEEENDILEKCGIRQEQALLEKAITRLLTGIRKCQDVVVIRRVRARIELIIDKESVLE